VDKRDGRFLSPSGLNDFLACEHLAALELAVARDELARPLRDDPQTELIRRKGEEHEQAYLDRLKAEGKHVVEPADAATAERAIREATADVIYQARFEHGGWRGIADFLELQPDGTYEAADTKLARHSKPQHILQLCFYSEQLARIQGRAPVRMHVVLGSGARVSLPVAGIVAN
jgi:predicted RecB family nuclease